MCHCELQINSSISDSAQMPPKSSNKKLPATWYHCEVCDVHITSKERETHDRVCPIGASTTPGLEYIRDNSLYTANIERRTFNVEALSEVPAKYVNNLVFLSEGAMRLLHLCIGQQVAIQPLEPQPAPPLVRSVWPVPEKFLTTVFVSEGDYQLYWEALKGNSFRIAALPNGGAVAAKTIHLRMLHDSDSEMPLERSQLEDVERLLKYDLKHLIYTEGNRISLDFFNKALTFVVASWQPLEIQSNESDHSLEQAFDHLTLQGAQFFVVTGTTLFEIERSESVGASMKDSAAGSTNYTVTKANIGGLEKQLVLIEECIDMAMGFKSVPKGAKISRGLLLYGSNGCGKSLICEAMCTAVQQKSTSSLKASAIKINTSELFSRYLGETEKNLSAHFEKAFSNYPQPTLIIIEDVHNLCLKHQTNDMTKRVCVAFQAELDKLSSSRREVQRTFLIATTSQIDALNPNVRRYGRLDCEVEICAPTPKERTAILRCLLCDTEHDLSPEDIEEVAHVTHGFVGADLANLVCSAAVRALKNGNRKLNTQDLHASLTHVKPSAMREVLIESPNVHWDDIGGQEELKLKLKQAIEWPLAHPEKFKRLGIKPPRGILMFGPPGCSKTMVAKALATESQLNFLSIKGPELFSMWVGESERAVREVFRKARQVAPAIVFFDEIDAIGGERAEGGSAGGTSVKERVLTQLLTEMDGVEALENVTIVAATNRPDMIDKALLRPGRIDRIVYVGLPDAAARREIFRIKLRSMPLADDVHIDELVKCTDGYSGAEIQAVCHEAAIKSLEESFDAEYVSWQQFEYALLAVQPRTSPELLRLYDEYRNKS